MPSFYHARAENVPEGAQHVLLAIPNGRPVAGAYLDYLWCLSWHLMRRGVHADLLIISDHCHVDDCRNLICHIFLHETRCTDLFFLDDDTISTPEAVSELLRFDRDVIAGIYPFKQDEEGYPVILLDGEQRTEPDGALEVREVPTGFLRIRRSVIGQMYDASPLFWDDRLKDADGNMIPIAEIFRREIVPVQNGKTYKGRPVGKRWGGDYNFCRRWREIGGKIHIDPRPYFEHLGHKAYKGNFGKFLAHKNDIETPQFVAAFRRLQEGTCESVDFVRLVEDWGNPYSACYDLLMTLYLTVKDARGPVLETGSGLSTLIAAAANPGVMIHALEHDMDWFQRTYRAAEFLGLDNITLHYAPLKSYDFGLWYGLQAPLPDRFDVVLIDGPQRRFGRAGVFRVMGNAIRDAKVLADDANDPKEIEALNAWACNEGRTVHIMGEARKFAIALLPEPLREAAE